MVRFDIPIAIGIASFSSPPATGRDWKSLPAAGREEPVRLEDKRLNTDLEIFSSHKNMK
jgi:hypothetical protein